MYDGQWLVHRRCNTDREAALLLGHDSWKHFSLRPLGSGTRCLTRLLEWHHMAVEHQMRTVHGELTITIYKTFMGTL